METSEKYQAQAQMLANRVKKRFKHLHKRFTTQNLQVFRLYDWDIPEIRAVVDWYAGHLVVGEYARNVITSYSIHYTKLYEIPNLKASLKIL